MKILAQFLLTMILAFILAQFLPYWSVAVAAFLTAVFIGTGSWSSFWAGFLSIALLWITSAWIISDGNNNIILERVAAIFSLTPLLLLLVMGLLGGLLGGFGATTGSQLHRMIFQRKRRDNPYWR
jgi:hypothetical protein